MYMYSANTPTATCHQATSTNRNTPNTPNTPNRGGRVNFGAVLSPTAASGSPRLAARKGTSIFRIKRQVTKDVKHSNKSKILQHTCPQARIALINTMYVPCSTYYYGTLYSIYIIMYLRRVAHVELSGSSTCLANLAPFRSGSLS